MNACAIYWLSHECLEASKLYLEVQCCVMYVDPGEKSIPEASHQYDTTCCIVPTTTSTSDNQPDVSCRSYVQFHDDVKGADNDEDHDGEESPKRNTCTSIAGLLEKQIAGPLTRVQTALAKETVIWKRGILVMPKVCLFFCFPFPPPTFGRALPRPTVVACCPTSV